MGAATVTVTVTASSISFNINDNKDLPTPVKLSEELCKIVDRVHYSRIEALLALDNLYIWACTHDLDLLKWFDIHGGVAKVLDFLKETMKDMNCVGTFCMDCIARAACVIWQVTCPGEKRIQQGYCYKDCSNFNGL